MEIFLDVFFFVYWPISTAFMVLVIIQGGLHVDPATQNAAIAQLLVNALLVTCYIAGAICTLIAIDSFREEMAWRKMLKEHSGGLRR